jgi:SAM-dependent methyltransferase
VRDPPRSTGSELPDDFAALDFRALWKGRARTTEVEGGLVRRALGELPIDRVLELGTGDGRLSPFVRSAAAEYVGVDQSFEFLSRLRKKGAVRPSSLLIEANVFHLPLADGAATAAVLARVYNFLPDPVSALQEIARTLVPGGILVTTCNVRPSILTLVDDVRTALARRPGPRMTSMTFSRAEVVPVVPSSFPASAPTRRHFEATLRRAGYRPGEVYGSGLEDTRLTRFLPALAFLAAGVELGSAPIFPLVWRVGESGHRGAAVSLPPIASSIACPRCRRPFGPLELGPKFERACEGCGFLLRMESGILRARYVADD